MNKEIFYKEKLHEYLIAAGWYENRQEEVISKEYKNYHYPENVDRLYREFLHLDIWNCFEGEKKSYPDKLISFNEWGIIHSQEDYKESDEYFFSEVIDRKLYYIGSCGDGYLCIDGNLNLYIVNEWGIDFWGYGFYTGLYNYMFLAVNSSDFIHYKIPFINYDLQSYKRNSKREIIWYDYNNKEKIQDK